MPSASATAWRTRVGSAIAASSTNHTPSANASCTAAPAWSARRVLPTPPAPVRVSRRVAPKLRATDLRFSGEEAAAFLTGSMGLPLTTQDVAALETRTEGWIAGLQLAAL